MSIDCVYQPTLLSHRQRIVRRLYQLGIDGEQFCQQMHHFGCVMVGSFPLQCLLDEYYNDSDINIFIPDGTVQLNSVEPFISKSDDSLSDLSNLSDDSNDSEISDHSQKEAQMESENSQYSRLEQCTTISETLRLHLFERWLCDQYHVLPSPIYIQNMISTRQYQITPNACITISIADPSKFFETIEDAFNLSFCQTMFDGLELRYDDLAQKKLGYITQPMGKSKQSLTHYPSQLDIEIDKYLDRGFKIINFNHMYQSTQHKLADQSDKSLKMAYELDNIKLSLDKVQETIDNLRIGSNL